MTEINPADYGKRFIAEFKKYTEKCAEDNDFRIAYKAQIAHAKADFEHAAALTGGHVEFGEFGNRITVWDRNGNCIKGSLMELHRALFGDSAE